MTDGNVPQISVCGSTPLSGPKESLRSSFGVCGLLSPPLEAELRVRLGIAHAQPQARGAKAVSMKRTVFILKKGGGAWFKLARKKPRKAMK